ncbi:hypothetical protein COL516b_009452 [Colletotrichum fioriniae]|nr:uncharacterized protein COL516b_009452 [Colletotrichum fioriniae]KAJ0299198.1 hypothetical protein COL516b_009452 [Colletotrichum fioriniae]
MSYLRGLGLFVFRMASGGSFVDLGNPDVCDDKITQPAVGEVEDIPGLEIAMTEIDVMKLPEGTTDSKHLLQRPQHVLLV